MRLTLMTLRYTVIIMFLQRLGTSFLPARVASWRYQRGRRSLEETLSVPGVSSSLPRIPSESQAADDENNDVIAYKCIVF